MSYMLRNGWHCQFLEADLKTPLPRKLNFPSPEKIVETAERGGYVMNLEDDRHWKMVSRRVGAVSGFS